MRLNLHPRLTSLLKFTKARHLNDTMTESQISITPLLSKLLLSNASVSAQEIASALALIFENRLSTAQCASLLTILHTSKRDHDPSVIAQCASRLREASIPIDRAALREAVRKRGRREGQYRGGLCDIVGTGGDGHSTFNVSTAASIVASSSLLLSKHGNRASSSTSGSADLVQALTSKAAIEAVTAEMLPRVYAKSNYAFLFAPIFHPGMRHVAPIRKDLGFRTIFNLLGPLANPVEGLIEARVVGVATQELGPVFAEALRLSGARKAMVVCGAENLDEISCAGKTFCWRLVERSNPAFQGSRNEEDDEITTSDEEAPPRTMVTIEEFVLEPQDFGLPTHALADVLPGRMPHENAERLMDLLKNESAKDDPTLDFVLMNTAALLVISGICEADNSSIGEMDAGKPVVERGPGGGRWKEGVRRARSAIESKAALRSLLDYIEIASGLADIRKAS